MENTPFHVQCYVPKKGFVLQGKDEKQLGSPLPAQWLNACRHCHALERSTIVKADFPAAVEAFGTLSIHLSVDRGVKYTV